MHGASSCYRVPLTPMHFGIYRDLGLDVRTDTESSLVGGATTAIRYFRTGQHYLNRERVCRERVCRDLLLEVLDASDGNAHIDYSYHLAPMTGDGHRPVRRVPTGAVSAALVAEALEPPPMSGARGASAPDHSLRAVCRSESVGAARRTPRGAAALHRRDARRGRARQACRCSLRTAGSVGCPSRRRS